MKSSNHRIIISSIPIAIGTHHHIRNIGTQKITDNHKSYRHDKFSYVGHNFFDILSLSIGKGGHLLKEPDTVRAIATALSECPTGKKWRRIC